jgi:transposase
MGRVESEGIEVRLKDGRTRRSWSKQQRREIVEETLKPGASVAEIARAHDVNANQLFKWRRLYQQGRLEAEPSSGTLLPVKISGIIQTDRPASRRKTRPRRTGIIDIDLGHARVRIEGTADPACVRAALEGLIP